MLNQLNPYDGEIINKLDCVNHVHKRMGAGLRSLLKTNKEITGGKGGLTSKKIDVMSSFYKKAIMDNITKSKDSIIINKNIQNMKQRIMANLNYSVTNPDPIIQHQLCNSSWCPYMKDQEQRTSTYNHNESKKKKTSCILSTPLASLVQKTI